MAQRFPAYRGPLWRFVCSRGAEAAGNPWFRVQGPSSNYTRGGSWVGISGVISWVTKVVTHIRGLITLLTTTHEPPSNVYDYSQA